jgi:hypothetical protein
MPYTNNRNGIYVTNSSGGTIAHGVPSIKSGIAGIAIKQKPVSWSAGLSAQNQIADAEVYLLQVHGEVQLGTASGESANGTSWAVGDKVYLAAASTTSGVTTCAASTTNTGTFLGRVTETPSSPAINSTYRVPAAKIRVDLDLKVV